jgi:ketosteroid isomerase-like protein
MTISGLLIVFGVLLGPGVAASRSTDREALLTADRAFALATAQKGLEGWVGAFAEDGFLVAPEGPLTPGLSGVRATMAPFFADPSSSLAWTPEQAEVAASGDLGYTIGSYERHTKDASGQTIVRTGRYLTIWRKEKNGSWKVAVDIGNAAQPRSR